MTHYPYTQISLLSYIIQEPLSRYGDFLYPTISPQNYLTCPTLSHIVSPLSSISAGPAVHDPWSAGFAGGEIKNGYSDTATTIWFDSWRYENEEFSALIPLVRTIILNLEKYVQELEIEKGPREDCS